MNELALFAGGGGGLLGGELLGWSPRCAVEIDPYCRARLLDRQADGILPRFAIWDDVRTFDGRPWRGSIDIVTGGFPCQDISIAGKGKGITGSRSSLWFEMLRIVAEVRPRFVLAENSPQLRTRGLGTVLYGLASLGYAARWGVLGAGDIGAPHLRKRMWIAAYPDSSKLREQSRGSCRENGTKTPITAVNGQPRHVAYSDSARKLQPQRSIQKQRGRASDSRQPVAHPPSERWTWGRHAYADVEKPQPTRSRINPKPWPPEPNICRVAYGVADRVDKLRALGNGQVPRVAAIAWHILTSDIGG